MLLLLMVNGEVTLAGLLVLKIEPSEFLTRWPVFTSDVKMFPYGSTATLCRAVKCGCKGRPTAMKFPSKSISVFRLTQSRRLVPSHSVNSITVPSGSRM
jgi:hypothetical protein